MTSRMSNARHQGVVTDRCYFKAYLGLVHTGTGHYDLHQGVVTDRCYFKAYLDIVVVL